MIGVSSSPGELSAKLNRFAKEIGDTRRPLTAAAFAAKQAFIAANPGVVGHRVPRKSRGKINVRYDVRGDTAIVRYTGPAHLVLNPTSPHRIRPRRRRGKKALTIGADFAAYADHPGTSGKDPGARRAKALAAVAAPKAYHQVGVVQPMRRIF